MFENQSSTQKKVNIFHAIAKRYKDRQISDDVVDQFGPLIPRRESNTKSDGEVFVDAWNGMLTANCYRDVDKAFFAETVGLMREFGRLTSTPRFTAEDHAKAVDEIDLLLAKLDK